MGIICLGKGKGKRNSVQSKLLWCFWWNVYCAVLKKDTTGFWADYCHRYKGLFYFFFQLFDLCKTNSKPLLLDSDQEILLLAFWKVNLIYVYRISRKPSLKSKILGCIICCVSCLSNSKTELCPIVVITWRNVFTFVSTLV